MSITVLNGDGINFQHNSAYLMRPRLCKLLGEAINYPLVAVYAGSGYGKTRAAYTYLKECGAYTTWIQLSELDNVATRFWESFTGAVSQSWPEAGPRFLEIGFPESEKAFAKFESIMREADLITGKHIMVYDDFHLLHNPAVLRFLERAFNIMPPSATVILISRTMPEINVVGMMLRERIFTIREDDLRFSEEEISAYFNQLALHVRRQDVRDIFDDTKGWAFAINLIGRSLRKGTKYERYALEAMKANVFKLLEAEISCSISNELWRFLLRISLIDHLAADLIRTLASNDALVCEIKKLNAYIRYDAHLDAYIIHHLFLDYLRQNQYLLTEDEQRETYLAAGWWCENNQHKADALTYYEKAKDYDTIIRITSAFSLQIPLDMVIFALDMLLRIPEREAQNNPLFSEIVLKLMVRAGLTDQASELAKKYSEYFLSKTDSPEKFRALSGIYCAWGLLRLIICSETDSYDFDVYCKKHSDFYEKAAYSIPYSAVNQSVGAWALPLGTTRAGAYEEYIESLTRAIPHLLRSHRGSLFGLDDLAKGELSYFRNDHGEAEQHLKQALSKAQEKNQFDIQNRSLLYLMRIAFSRGDLSSADRYYAAIRAQLDIPDYILRYTTCDVAGGYYYLTLTEPEQVPDWLKGDFEYYSHPLYMENYLNFFRAHYHYQTRQFGSLLAFIEREWGRQNILLGKIELKVLESLALYQLKRKNEAYFSLTEAYSLAEPNNFVFSFIPHSKDMRTLTAAALRDGKCAIPSPWLEGINRKASAYAKKQAHMISKYKVANKTDDEITLSRRESEILKDLSQGLSRTEIAANQNISVNTAKMVINSIYDKLNANSLADAIRIAVDRRIV